MGEDSRVPALSRRVPGATKRPAPVTRATPSALPETPLELMRRATEAAEAITAPIPVITAPLASDVATSTVEEINSQPHPVAQPCPVAQPDRAAEAPAAREPVAAPQAQAEQQAEWQEIGRQAPAGRRKHAATALMLALVLITIGSVAFVLARHTAASGAHRRDGAEATRNLAAAWVAAQVSHAAIVSCDPDMCQALAAHGMPAGDLLELRSGAADPRRSAVIVATADVRGLLGSRLRLVYAPEAIATFGSGRQRIDIREVAPQGANAYAAAVRADLLARLASGAELLRSQRILVSAAARRQLKAGQVDSRLLITIAGMAAMHPVRILAFGDAGPVAGPGSPLRSADLAAADAAAGPASAAAATAAPGPGSSGFVRSMLAFLRAQHAPYLPAHAGAVRLADGQAVLRIEFAAPSPLGLLNPSAP